ncbi:MAG: winged helix-turn-helix domain-containing protein [Phycisphaerales bacterium]|nr:winged helix-turn-helix domain-containing protein [Phycisphaerales bacterium]
MSKQRKAPPLLTDHELRGLVAASTLDRYQRSTLLAMADGLYRHELRITLSHQRLANALGLGRRATIDRIHSLEGTGVILKERGGGGRYENGKGRINVWRLDLDALRNQALAKAEKLESNTENNAPESIDKGAVGCTVKGAVEKHQGCSGATATVQPTAQDQVSPIPQEKKTNGIARPRHLRGGGTMPIYNPNDLRPWANRFDAPKQTRANRLKQMRMQLAHSEDSARNTSKSVIHSTTEGEK